MLLWRRRIIRRGFVPVREETRGSLKRQLLRMLDPSACRLSLLLLRLFLSVPACAASRLTTWLAARLFFLLSFCLTCVSLCFVFLYFFSLFNVFLFVPTFRELVRFTMANKIINYYLSSIYWEYASRMTARMYVRNLYFFSLLVCFGYVALWCPLFDGQPWRHTVTSFEIAPVHDNAPPQKKKNKTPVKRLGEAQKVKNAAG